MSINSDESPCLQRCDYFSFQEGPTHSSNWKTLLSELNYSIRNTQLLEGLLPTAENVLEGDFAKSCIGDDYWSISSERNDCSNLLSLGIDWL